MAYLGVSPSNGVRKVHTYTATASQTTFSGAGAENISLSYRDSTYIDVYQNGVKLGDADYTATSGTSVVLGTGASADDIVVVVVYDVFSVADTVSKTDGGQFDGAVTFAGAFTSLGIDDNADANAITIDSSERVGIGNTTPDGGKLHVTNSTGAIGYFQSTQSASNVENIILNATQTNSSANLSFQINNGTTAKGQFRLNGDNSLEFRNGTTLTERMRIDSSGNVGIGTSSPSAALQVVGSFSNQIKFGTNTSVYTDISMGTGFTVFDSVGGDSGAFDFRDDGTSRIFIDSSGKVGIGTSSPSNRLHIKTTSSGGTAQSRSGLIIEDDGGNADSIQFLSNDSGFQSIFFGDASDNDVGRIGYSHSGDNMRFSAGATESMRITSDSVGGLGHTGGNASISSEGFVFRKNTNGNHLEIGHGSAAGNGFSFLLCRYNNSSIGGISQDGTTGVDFDTSSDYRLKENVSYDFDATTRLKKLKPCRFNFIAESDRTVDGFLAHEVEDAVPQAVKGDKDAVDAKGNIVSQMIDHSKLVPLLTKTLQEALTRIDTLEAEVKTLKGE